MAVKPSTAELDTRFSSGDAVPTAWPDVLAQLESAEIYWISTVRPDGRPHVTPMIAAWLDDVLYFSTGPTERKAKNLAHNPHCVVTTGCNAITGGLDITLEGSAVPERDETVLQRIADRYAEKYDWHFTVQDGAFLGEGGGKADAYAVQVHTVFAFAKGKTFGQTRWRIPS